ncbi:hypothetical protein A9Q81_04600 [Gammaproteobacteria bacterium 42_54_T18]|nr:hypothetical protein A9Q81_04600 [Gammaproteobacteria bacterium 42_54_T18]
MVRYLQPATQIRWLLFIVFCLAGCDVSEPQKLETSLHLSGPTMGTWYNIKVVSEVGVNRDFLSKKIKTVLSDINGLMSTYDHGSELSRFNQLPINTPMEFSSDTVIVLKMALDLSVETEGAFDVTVGPAVNLWGFGPDGRLKNKPSEIAINEALSQVGYQALVWHSDNQLSKSKPVYVDLSAIAKGFAVDKIAALLREQGYSRFLVDIGGELLAGEEKSPGQNWKVAVEQPDAHQRAIQKVISLRRMGVATSGDYRNFYEFEGERYSHTIDPRTGKPVANTLASVSVLHPSVAYADGIATALMVLGTEQGFALANKLGISAYFIYKTSSGFEVKATDGFLNYLMR